VPSKKLLAHRVWQKNCCSLSPTFCADEILPICKVKFAKLIRLMPDGICQTACAKKASRLAIKKKPREYVGKIDP